MKNSIDKKVILHDGFQIIFETPDDGYSYFFGYYDKKPLNESGTRLLAHRVSFDGRDVEDGDVAEIGYFDFPNKKFNKIDETLAWNWQQGSQLQWLPPTFDEKVIYNNILDGKFVSIIYNLQTKERKVIPFPIYVVHPNGKEALAVNYERHYWCRPGYNYQNIKEKKWDLPIHPEDGIFRVDLENGDVSLIVRTQDIVDVMPNEEILSSNNWLEHMMYDPSGERFIFFHRWYQIGIDKSRFFTCSRDGSNLVMYPDGSFYSHYDWVDSSSLIVWTYEPQSLCKKSIKYFDKIKENIIGRLFTPVYSYFKPILPNKIKGQISHESKLILFQDITLTHEILGDACLRGNGHTIAISDKNILLTDTYQDKDGYRHLFFYDRNMSKINPIGEFYSVYNDCGYRCDLHPRVNNDCSVIIIDSAHVDKRKILLIGKVKE